METFKIRSDVIIEEWKEINGYKISSYERVINSKGYELKNTPSKEGDYVRCSINLGENIGVVSGMHRIVATAFIPNPDCLPEVNHIDGCKSNNKIDNLEWISKGENQQHASYVLHKRAGETCHFSKLTDKEALEIYDLCKYTKYTYYEIADMYNINKNIPQKIASCTKWKHLELEPIHRMDKPIIGTNIETMIITEKKTDLFKLDNSYTLVHCISEDCAMGKGIAKIFDKKFKKMKKDIFDTLVYNELHYPISIMFLGEKQNVINMITKKEYWHKPTYKTFEIALDDVVKICKKYNITKLGMPKIGCGLDRLQWGKVRTMVEDKFKDLDIEIIVCYL